MPNNTAAISANRTPRTTGKWGGNPLIGDKPLTTQAYLEIRKPSSK
jgi:hypothetical protein